MIKLVIFFRKPADIQAFEEHFSHRHVPLIAAMPKVVRTSVARALGAPRGEPPYYLIHEIYFADMASLNYALNSAQGRAAGADLMTFARDIVSLMFAEVWGEDSMASASSAGAMSESVPSYITVSSRAPSAPMSKSEAVDEAGQNQGTPHVESSSAQTTDSAAPHTDSAQGQVASA